MIDSTQIALDFLAKATTPYGILASINPTDNYDRIWARDSAIAGLAGLWTNDKIVSDGLYNSLKTLGNAQGKSGQIPSNVDIKTGKISYGGLAGRTDATLWWLIGLSEFLKKYDDSIKTDFEYKVKKALAVLAAWEFNERGLIYSPLGGNWADEYVTQGYTLYDNMLYLWVLENIATVYNWEACASKAGLLRDLLTQNYYIAQKLTANNDYHPTARENARYKPPYWVASFAPNGYDVRFDMAGNALAIFMNLGSKNITQEVVKWLKTLVTAQNNWLLPVFYPVIKEGDMDWSLLQQNFAYQFKNKPYHFHNGGCWFVWLGFLGYALRKNGFEQEADAIAAQITNSLSTETPSPYTFYEYRNTNNFSTGGVANLSFSAAGTVFSNLRSI